MIDIPRFIEDAKSFENVPYHHQGRSRFGIDCIGLAIAALRMQGVMVEASADYGKSPRGDQLLREIEASGLVDRLDPRTTEIMPGDILIFTLQHDPQHVGIALDIPGHMIHAASGVKFVRTVPLTDHYLSKLTHIYRWR